MTLRVSAPDDMTSYGPYCIAILPIDPGPEHTSGTLTFGDTVAEAIDLAQDIDEYTANVTPGDLVMLYVQGTAAVDTSSRIRVEPTGFSEYLGSDPLSYTVKPGEPLRANGSRLLVAGPKGPYRFSVTGERGLDLGKVSYHLGIAGPRGRGLRRASAKDSGQSRVGAGGLIHWIRLARPGHSGRFARRAGHASLEVGGRDDLHPRCSRVGTHASVISLSALGVSRESPARNTIASSCTCT